MTDAIDTETEDVGTETFSFDAGRWAWRGFVEEMVEAADARGVDIDFRREPGLLWGLIGVTIIFTVTGRPSEVAEFVAFAEHRAHLWQIGGGSAGGG